MAEGNLAINVMGFSIGGAGGQGGTYPWIFTPNGQGGYIVAFNLAPNLSIRARGIRYTATPGAQFPAVSELPMNGNEPETGGRG